MVYVKIDAIDQLLLSEEVCRQLGIVCYHTGTEVWRGGQQKKPKQELKVLRVSYCPQDGQIQIHQSRVKPCPDFPAGFHWYGSHRHRPGRPPKWVDKGSA